MQLSQIKSAPEPIRTTWDEEKLNELTESILEQGLIVPIKVRPTDNNHYEVVYGHRRVEALRRAEIEDLPDSWVIVEGLDKIETHQQALTENKVREDMSPYDVALALKKDMEQTGETQAEVGDKYGMSRQSVSAYLKMLDYDDIRLSSPQHIMEASAGLGEDKTDLPKVLEKVAKEDLSKRQARKVAESVAVTKDPRVKEQLLKAPYDPYLHDPDHLKERAERYGEHDPQATEKTPSPGKLFEATLEVKMIIDYLKTSRKEMTKEVLKMYEVGKFSPEAVPYIIREAEMNIKAWQQVIDKLKE